jgi:MFS family permease
MLGAPVGVALSFLFCGLIAQAWGWRIALVSAAAPALLLVPLLLLVQEPEIAMPVLSILLALVLYLGSRAMRRDLALQDSQQESEDTS